jgi:hypothetical protein
MGGNESSVLLHPCLPAEEFKMHAPESEPCIAQPYLLLGPPRVDASEHVLSISYAPGDLGRRVHQAAWSSTVLAALAALFSFSRRLTTSCFGG